MKLLAVILFRFHLGMGTPPPFITAQRADLAVNALMSIRTVQTALRDLVRLRLIEYTTDGRTLKITLSDVALHKCNRLRTPNVLRKLVQKESAAPRRRVVSGPWYRPDPSGDMRVFIDGALVERVADTGNDERRMIIEALIVRKYGTLPASCELYQRRYAEFEKRTE
jgi:hypothetical protein